MTRRIVHVIPSLARSSAEQQLTMLSAGLAREDFEVHVLAICDAGPLIADLAEHGIPLTTIPRRWPLDPTAYAALRRNIMALKPDLVHTWGFVANTYGRFAAHAAGVRAVVASERGVDRWKRWHHGAVDRHLARFSGAVVVNSPDVRDFYAEHGIRDDKLRMIPDGIPPTVTSRLTRQQLLDELQLPSGVRLVGAVGRLWPYNRFKQLIWATDLLHVIRDDVHLLVVGEGPQRKILQRYRTHCTMDEHVHFLGERDDLDQLLPHFDVLWQASGPEGLPGPIMKAMAAGVPVVVTDTGTTQGLVVHGESGFLVPGSDRAELARYANKLLDDSELAARLGSTAKARIGSEFTPHAMVARHTALYRELLD